MKELQEKLTELCQELKTGHVTPTAVNELVVSAPLLSKSLIDGLIYHCRKAGVQYQAQISRQLPNAVDFIITKD